MINGIKKNIKQKIINIPSIVNSNINIFKYYSKNTSKLNISCLNRKSFSSLSDKSRNNKESSINDNKIKEPFKPEYIFSPDSTSTCLHGHFRKDGLNAIQISKPDQKRIIKREEEYFKKWKSLIDVTYREWDSILKEVNQTFKQNNTSDLIVEDNIIGDFIYFNKSMKGYELLYRKPILDDKEQINSSVNNQKANEELVFDITKIPFLSKRDLNLASLKNLSISDDQTKIAFVIDIDNNENTIGGVYLIKEKEYIDIKLENINNVEFSSSKDDLIVLRNNKLMRPNQVCLIDLQTKIETSIYKSENTSLEIFKSKDKEMLFINSLTKNDSEILVFNLKNKELSSLLPRIHKTKYFVDCYKNNFYILSNINLVEAYKQTVGINTSNNGSISEINQNKFENFKVFTIPYDKICNQPMKSIIQNLEILINPISNQIFQEMQIAQDNIIIFSKNSLKAEVLVYNLQSKKLTDYSVKKSYGEISSGINKDVNSDKVHFTFSNPYTPNINYFINIKEDSLKLNSTNKEVIDMNQKLFYDYVLNVEEAPAKDGESIPYTVFYKKGLVKKDRKNKVLLIGYGAYGLNNDIYYDPAVLTAVEKGWIVVYSHIRGGYEKGEYWHEFGKLDNKNNSINDYISVALSLIEKGYTHPNFITGYGASAGATVVAQAMNKIPKLFKACILNHPFLDILSTLLNTEYRLSESDYEEFGNPIINKKDYFNIIGWSPYENISVQEYPAVFITMSLEDSRVPAFGTLKYIEKLRLKSKTPDERLPDFIKGYKNICVQIEKEGHFGPLHIKKALESKLNELAWADKMLLENISF